MERITMNRHIASILVIMIAASHLSAHAAATPTCKAALKQRVLTRFTCSPVGAPSNSNQKKSGMDSKTNIELKVIKAPVQKKETASKIVIKTDYEPIISMREALEYTQSFTNELPFEYLEEDTLRLIEKGLYIYQKNLLKNNISGITKSAVKQISQKLIEQARTQIFKKLTMIAKK